MPILLKNHIKILSSTYYYKHEQNQDDCKCEQNITLSFWVARKEENKRNWWLQLFQLPQTDNQNSSKLKNRIINEVNKAQ